MGWGVKKENKNHNGKPKELRASSLCLNFMNYWHPSVSCEKVEKLKKKIISLIQIKIILKDLFLKVIHGSINFL